MSTKESKINIENVSSLASRVFAVGGRIREDVINDFGSGSLFVVDFDSLFLIVATKSRELNENEILYRMERELSMYLDRRGRVEVVAFSKFDLPVFSKLPKLKELRKLCLDHLINKVKTKNLVRVVTNMSSPYEKEYYESYLSRVAPSFVVLHSGTCASNLLSESDRDMLRVHWLRLVSIEMRVVFGCDHITAESSKLRAFGLDSNIATQIVRAFDTLLLNVANGAMNNNNNDDDDEKNKSSIAAESAKNNTHFNLTVNMDTPLLSVDGRMEEMSKKTSSSSSKSEVSDMWKWHSTQPLSYPGSEEKKWERSLTKQKKIEKADLAAKEMIISIAKEEHRRVTRGKGPPFDEREHGRVSGQKLHHAVQSNRIDLKEQGLRRTFVKLISRRFQENRDKMYTVHEFFDVVRGHREKQEEEEEKRFQQSIAKIIVRSAQSLKGSMLEHSSAVLVQRNVSTIQSKSLLARERNQKKPRRQHLKKLQRLVKESLSSCCEDLNSQDVLFGGSNVKRSIVMRVKYDEDLTFDPLLEFRVRSTFLSLFREQAEPKLLDSMKECLARCAENLVLISNNEKKSKTKKKSLPYGPKKLLEVLHPNNVELHVTGWGETKEAKDQWSAMVSSGLLRELRFDQMRTFVKTHWKSAPRTCADALMAMLRTLTSSSKTSKIMLWELLLEVANPRVDNLGKVFLDHDPSILDGVGGSRPVRKELLLDSDVTLMLRAFAHLNLEEGARDLIGRLKTLDLDLPSVKSSSSITTSSNESYVNTSLDFYLHLRHRFFIHFFSLCFRISHNPLPYSSPTRNIFI